MDNFQTGLAAVTPTGAACGGKGGAAIDAEGMCATAGAPSAQMVEEGRSAECCLDISGPVPKALLRRSLVEQSEALAALGSWALVCGLDIASAWPEPGVAGGRWSWAVALVALLLATVFLAADWLPTLGHGRRPNTSGGTLTRFLKCRPWALAAHIMLLGGCFLWLMLHVAAQRGPQVCVGVATFWTLLSLAAVRLATCAREAATERCKAAGHGTPHGTSEEGSCGVPDKKIAGSQGAFWPANSSHHGKDASGQCHGIAPIVTAASGTVSNCVEVEAAEGSAPLPPHVQTRPAGVADLVVVPASPGACTENCQTCGSPVQRRSSGSRQQQDQRWKPLFPENRGEDASPAPVRPPTADASPYAPPLPSAVCPTLAMTSQAASQTPLLAMNSGSGERSSRDVGVDQNGSPRAPSSPSSPSSFKAPSGRPAVGQSLFNDPWQLQSAGVGHWDDGQDMPLRIGAKPKTKYGSGNKPQHPAPASNSVSPTPTKAVAASEDEVVSLPSPSQSATASSPAPEADAATAAPQHAPLIDAGAAAETGSFSRQCSAPAATDAAAASTAHSAARSPGSDGISDEESPGTTTWPLSRQSLMGEQRAEEVTSESSGKSDQERGEPSREPDETAKKHEETSAHQTSAETSGSATAKPVARISLVIPGVHAKQLGVPNRSSRRRVTPNPQCVVVTEESDGTRSSTRSSPRSVVEAPGDISKSPIASPDSSPKASAKQNGAVSESVADAGAESERVSRTSTEETKVETRVEDGGVNVGSGKLVEAPKGLKTPDAEDNPPSETGVIDPETLRKAILTNITRRPVAIGDPIGGARIEELHEILHRPGDEKPSTASTADFSGSHYTDLSLPASPPGGMSKLDWLNGDGMSTDSFNRLRENYHAAEAQVPQMLAPANMAGGPSLWPKLLTSIQNSMVQSRGSRRASFLPPAAGDQSSSRRASNIKVTDNAAEKPSRGPSNNPSQSGSRRGSHSNADVAGGNSRNQSRNGSRRGSRMGSRRTSRAGSRVGSRRGSRQASRSNSFVADADMVNSRKMSAVSDVGRRNSLFLPDQVESSETREQCPSCGNIYMSDAKFCRKCGVQRVQEGEEDTDARRSVSKSLRRKSSLLKVGASPKPVTASPQSLLEQVAEAAEAASEGNAQPPTDKRKDAMGRSPSPRRTAPAALLRELTPNCVRAMQERDGDASAGSPGGSHDVTPSAGSPRESPVPSAVPVSLTINGEQIAESHVTPQAPRCASTEGVEEEEPQSKGIVANDEEDYTEANMLRKALANHPPEMTLKELFLQEDGMGNVSLESLRHVAADWARSKGDDELEDEDDDASEDDSNGEDEVHSSSEDDESEEDDMVSPYDPILDQLNLDPGTVSEALKMLMMLNDGFKAHHCNCKPQGPHTCMSPAVSQLASQVQTTLHSLSGSLSASLAGSVAVTRRSSVAQTRRQSIQAAVRHRRSSGDNKLVIEKLQAETSTSPVDTTNGVMQEGKRSSKIKFTGLEQDLPSMEAQSPTASGDSPHSFGGKEGSPSSFSPHSSPAHKKNRRSLEKHEKQLEKKKSVEELEKKKSVEDLPPPPPPYASDKDKISGSPKFYDKRGSAMLGTRGWRMAGGHVHFSGAEPCGNEACNTADAGAGPSSSQ